MAIILNEPYVSVIKKLEHTEMACLLSWMSGKETSMKKLLLFSQGERLMTIIDNSLSYLFFMLYFKKEFIFDDEKEVGERKRDRSIYRDLAGFNNSKKSNKKTHVKFAILLHSFSFVYFSLVIESFRISASLISFLASGSELLLNLKLRSKSAT